MTDTSSASTSVEGTGGLTEVAEHHREPSHASDDVVNEGAEGIEPAASSATEASSSAVSVTEVTPSDLSDADDEDDDEDDDDEDDEDDEDDDDEASAGEREASSGGGRSAASRAADLFRESEIAADYIEGLLDILDLDGDIDELVVSGRPMVEVIAGEGDSAGRRLQTLVGTRGATLEALQELARLAVYRKIGSPSRLLLDVGGYRAARRKELTAIAKNAAEKVKEYGEAVRLDAMSAFERKCVHDVINAMAGLESESDGVEPARRVVIRPVP